jgi:hypothetical protein
VTGLTPVDDGFLDQPGLGVTALPESCSALALKKKGLRHFFGRVTVSLDFMFSLGPEEKGIETSKKRPMSNLGCSALALKKKGLRRFGRALASPASRCSALALKKKGLRPIFAAVAVVISEFSIGPEEKRIEKASIETRSSRRSGSALALYPDGPIAVEALRVIGAAMAQAGVVGIGRLTLSRREGGHGRTARRRDGTVHVARCGRGFGRRSSAAPRAT